MSIYRDIERWYKKHSICSVTKEVREQFHPYFQKWVRRHKVSWKKCDLLSQYRREEGIPDPIVVKLLQTKKYRGITPFILGEDDLHSLYHTGYGLDRIAVVIKGVSSLDELQERILEMVYYANTFYEGDRHRYSLEMELDLNTKSACKIISIELRIKMGTWLSRAALWKLRCFGVTILGVIYDKKKVQKEWFSRVRNYGMLVFLYCPATTSWLELQPYVVDRIYRGEKQITLPKQEDCIEYMDFVLNIPLNVRETFSVLENKSFLRVGRDKSGIEIAEHLSLLHQKSGMVVLSEYEDDKYKRTRGNFKVKEFSLWDRIKYRWNRFHVGFRVEINGLILYQRERILHFCLLLVYIAIGIQLMDIKLRI